MKASQDPEKEGHHITIPVFLKNVQISF